MIPYSYDGSDLELKKIGGHATLLNGPVIPSVVKLIDCARKFARLHRRNAIIALLKFPWA